ncbi:hypothetical protein Pfo_016079 [Paulownia fortunei]|nr:hypothetical protein Pfo_016079 [Paulownia fortunei]
MDANNLRANKESEKIARTLTKNPDQNRLIIIISEIQRKEKWENQRKKTAEISLKDQGNEFFKAGNYLKAAALYTQAIKQDPSKYKNPFIISAFGKTQQSTCRCRENSQFETRVGKASFQVALKYNAQSSEMSKKIKRLTQLTRDKKQAQEVETMRSNVDVAKHLESVKSKLSSKYGAEDCWKEIFSFLVETMEKAVKSWHETSNVDPRVYFQLHKDKTDTEKYAPVVNIDKAFVSPHTHSSCFPFLRQYAEDSFSRAACLLASKSKISYPQEGIKKLGVDKVELLEEEEA